MNSDEVSDEITATQHSHWSFGGTLIWSAFILAIFFTLPFVILGVVVAVTSGPLSEPELRQKILSAAKHGNTLSLIIVITSLVCLGLLVGAVKIKKGAVLKEYFAIKLVPLKTMVKWIGLLTGLLVLYDLVALSLGHPLVPDFMSAAYETANPLLPFAFALIVAAPLFEEAFFRGFLFKGLESSFLGPVGTIVVTAGSWAAIHLQYTPFEMAIIFCLGLLLGAARVFTGSLLVPLGLHAITNLVATIETAIQA